MKADKNTREKTSYTRESIIVPIHIIALTIAFLGPFVVLGYQALHWAKHGEWLSIPISVTGFESWQGLANLPLSLGVFVVVLLLCKVISTFYSDES